jgi:site-specific DNA recombinase
VIVAEYFDSGQSRSVPWQRRPQANALLAELRNPDRAFDAVVIGEPQREFYGNQFGNTFPLFVHFDVPLWVPEVGGPIDPNNEAHDLIMSVFGGMSKGERNRIKVRVRTAMAAQAQIEGRFLGGRPPYGYHLADLGPHPNPAKAADGRRLHGLDIDPSTAPVVVRIFAEFLSGAGLFAIAEGLTRDGIACPSAHDPARNRHRCGIAWSKGAVRAILTNPRYTGRQVWNKQRKQEVLLDINDVALGHVTKLRWNPAEAWVHSDQPAHPPIIDQNAFDDAQQTLRARGRGPAQHKPHRTSHPYQLRSRLHCGLCERRMQGEWNHDAAYYRCRFPNEYALANKINHPRNVYLREDAITPALERWLTKIFAPARIDPLVEQLHAAQDTAPDATAEQARRAITEADRKLVRHRAALEALGDHSDPTLIASWIVQTQAERAAAEARLRQGAVRTKLSRTDIARLLAGFADYLTVLRDADPKDKAALYGHISLKLTYYPATHIVRAEAQPRPYPSEIGTCPRGDLNPHALVGH